MDESRAWERLRAAQVGRLATADAGGIPHVVPFVFAALGSTVYWVVDAKPKRSPRLKRIANIQANPNVELVVDHYDDDWSRLWWVRASGTGRIVEDSAERDRAVAALAEKYVTYRTTPPDGQVVAIDVTRIRGWEA
ncbi:MAG TPA: TIGR03668 family PPOX class F420-dependent oxidoreductase [Actinomycetota bacterium]|nr:TIGR03668 family PPOX class F420-dependent oxidoreductase [Actinomycetota bacterium]